MTLNAPPDTTGRAPLLEAALILENDLDAAGWDQYGRIYQINGTLADPRFRLLGFGNVIPTEQLQLVYERYGTPSRHVIGIAFAFELKMPPPANMPAAAGHFRFATEWETRIVLCVPRDVPSVGWMRLRDPRDGHNDDDLIEIDGDAVGALVEGARRVLDGRPPW